MCARLRLDSRDYPGISSNALTLPSFGKGLVSIPNLETIALAGLARLAKCRHHFELGFLAGVPFSLKTALTSESERQRARERQVGQERARERVRESEIASERAKDRKR
jgi:hypothetical protein